MILKPRQFTDEVSFFLSIPCNNKLNATTPNAPIGLSHKNPILKMPALVSIKTVSTNNSANTAAQKTT